MMMAKSYQWAKGLYRFQLTFTGLSLIALLVSYSLPNQIPSGSVDQSSSLPNMLIKLISDLLFLRTSDSATLIWLLDGIKVYVLAVILVDLVAAILQLLLEIISLVNSTSSQKYGGHIVSFTIAGIVFVAAGWGLGKFVQEALYDGQGTFIVAAKVTVSCAIFIGISRLCFSEAIKVAFAYCRTSQ